MTGPAVQTMFSKLIVGDEEAMTTYYCAVFGLKPAVRVQGESAGTGEKFREVILTRDGQMSGGSLVMFNFVDRPAPRDQQVTLGFVVDDVEAVAERVVANGGTLVAPIKSQPEHGVKVLFAKDPEGALSEIVELLPH